MDLSLVGRPVALERARPRRADAVGDSLAIHRADAEEQAEIRNLTDGCTHARPHCNRRVARAVTIRWALDCIRQNDTPGREIKWPDIREAPARTSRPPCAGARKAS